MSTCCCCYAIVSQSTVGIMEGVGGQFDDVIPPGCTCFNPCAQKLAGAQTLRPQMISCDVSANTRDSASIFVKIAIMYRAIPAEVHRAYYSMSDTGDQIKSMVVSSLRSFLPEQTLDQVFLERDRIASSIRQALGASLHSYGYELLDVLLEDVTVRGTVRESMNQQVYQKYNRVAQQYLGEIDKMRQIKHAEAEAEASRLRGMGTAMERAAIASAFKQGMDGFDRHGDMSESELTALVLMTQYFDMIDDISKHGKVKPATYFFPTKAGRLDRDTLRERLKRTFENHSKPSQSKQSNRVIDDADV